MYRLLVMFSLIAMAALAQTKAGDTANGKRLFERNGCYECHGYVGQGGAAGARLAQTKSCHWIAFTALCAQSEIRRACLRFAPK